ncbi:MAG: cell division protein FtsZ, partial [Hyphomicrobiaceae bacterium]
MPIKIELPEPTDLNPRITVVGVGGAGGNAINNMIASGLQGADFIAANTDAQALAMSSAERRIQLGVHLTEGLGAGARPEVGRAAAEEATDQIRSELAGSHMVFIAAGMGGGTGTGGASVVANIARELGALTVAIVSKPFLFEGSRRMRVAEAGIEQLRHVVDTLIVIPNQNLFKIATERTTFAEAFVLADQVLYSGVACIVDLIMKDGLINLDFADVRTVMSDM